MFINRNSFLPAFTLFPLLYLLGILFSSFITLVTGVRDADISSLIVTSFVFLTFLFLLPIWVKLRWGNKLPWKALGLAIETKAKSLRLFMRGFCIGLSLICILLLFVLSGGWINDVQSVSLQTLTNAVLLVFLVGIAEELIFRGWLFTEMVHLFGVQFGFILQAIIFSLVHLKIYNNFFSSVFLSIGLFLLGLLLAYRRILDKGSLWGCIGLHGSLVGIWFVIDSGFVIFSSDIPTFLIGLHNSNPNPISGIISIVILSIICYSQKSTFSRMRRFFAGTLSASSSEELP